MLRVQNYLIYLPHKIQYMDKVIATFLISIFTLLCSAQVCHPTAWLRADSATLGFPTWTDVSGNALDATPTSGTMPTAFSRINFNKCFEVSSAEAFTLPLGINNSRQSDVIVVYETIDTVQENALWQMRLDTTKRIGQTTQRILNESGQITYHPDHLGSSSWITTTNGSSVQHLHYLPWGEDFINQRSSHFDGVRYTFSAKEKDSETGLSYFGSRYYSSDLSIWLSVDPMAAKYPSLSPYVYCANNPVKLVDPNGEEINPVYDCDGNFIANTKEGFSGEILIYSGDDDIDFANMTKDEAMKNAFVDTYDYQRPNMSNEAKSNIWTSIVSHYEGLRVYDEVFSMKDIKGEKIGFGESSTGAWTSTYCIGRGNGEIAGSDLYSYKSTVENIASSIIVHEWYSHIKKNNGNRYKSHRLAYKNVINFKYFWNNTTDDYKGFNVRTLLEYTTDETRQKTVDPPYRYSYNKYKNCFYGMRFSPFSITLIPEILYDTAVLAKGMDSVSLLFWNIYTTNKYEGYVFSFSQKSHSLTLMAAYGSAKVMKIDNQSEISTIVQYINQFYILKSSPIILKKSAKEEIVCTDYPTITIKIYNDKYRKIFASSNVETDSYILTLHPDFIHFWELLLEYINEYDKMY